MKNLIYLVFIVFLFCCVNKQKESVNEQRIISLAPSITEILYALDLDSTIVAVSDYCKFPEQVNEKEKVGGLFNPNLEKIASLKPTLVFATESNQQLNEKIADPNIKVVLLPEKTIRDLYFSIDSIAILNGVQNRAKALISSIRDSLTKYRLNTDKNKAKAILVLGRDIGTTTNIGISGPGAFINELWEQVGGANAFPDMPGSFTQVNREELLSRNPNIIIEFKSATKWDVSGAESSLDEWQDLRVDAVRKGNIFVINGVDFLIPGPRIYLLAKEYYHILKKYHRLN